MNIDTLKEFSSILGMIGGVLGVFVFIDNYILKFNPKFNISNKLFFHYKTEEKAPNVQGKSLESVILKIEVINRRNKIGRIDDFAVRVYNSDITFPLGYMLYAENILKRLPNKSSSFDKDLHDSFSPIPILNRSTKNFVIEFKPEKYMGPTLKPKGSLKLDLLYFLPEKGWRLVRTFTLHCFNEHNNQQTQNGIMEYSLLENIITREEASKSLKQPEVTLYKGISGKYISFYLMKPVWILEKTVTYPLKLIKLIAALLVALVRQISSCCIVLPLIKLKSKTLPRVRISLANTHLATDTTDALKRCRASIKKIAEKINANADSKAIITILDTDENYGFSIRRGGLVVKFYKSGDGYISVQDTDQYPHTFIFSLKLVEYPFNLRLWKVNNKIMTIETACIHIMDSFILLAH